LPDQDIGVMLRSDNALVFSELYCKLANSYGIAQEVVLPPTSQQSDVAEFQGTLKLECVLQERFATYDEASVAIVAWICHYNETRPHGEWLPHAGAA
jgi:Integrase core domain